MMGAQGSEPPILNPSVEIVEGYYLDSTKPYTYPLENAGYTDFCSGANSDTIVYLNPDSSLKNSSGYFGKILRFKTADHSNLQGTTNCRMDGNPGSFTTTGNQKWFQINVDIRNLAGSYCINRTTGKVYWAGKNTQFYEKTAVLPGLCNGVYAKGKVEVTNGNHYAINSPAAYTVIPVSLTKEIPIVVGDVISVWFSEKPSETINRWGIGGQSGYVVTNPDGQTWYDFVVQTDGKFAVLNLEPRADGMIGNFDISIKVNGEVIF